MPKSKDVGCFFCIDDQPEGSVDTHAAERVTVLELSLAEHTFTNVKYSVLYFAWKLPEKGSACCELYGRKNAEDES